MPEMEANGKIEVMLVVVNGSSSFALKHGMHGPSAEIGFFVGQMMNKMARAVTDMTADIHRSQSLQAAALFMSGFNAGLNAKDDPDSSAVESRLEIDGDGT